MDTFFPQGLHLSTARRPFRAPELVGSPRICDHQIWSPGRVMMLFVLQQH